MNTMIYVIGAITAFAGVIAVAFGAAAIVSALRWRITWKWADSRQIARSVRLGWNAGMPPENVWFFVREYADKAKNKYMGGCVANYQWSLMKRIDDRCYSINGGFSTPATNITGWMLVEQDSIEASVRNASEDKTQ